MHYAETLREMSRSGPQEIVDSPPNSAINTAAVDETQSRWLTYDGCWQQLNSVASYTI